MKDSTWISAADALPTLPNVPFCNMFVLAYNEGDTKSRPMLYQRSAFRGKPVEKWMTASGGETYRTPDYWQPLPKPPKQQRKTAKECEYHD